MNPPLEVRKTRGLNQGLKKYHDVIATDHAPHTKEKATIYRAPFGIVDLKQPCP